MATMTIEIPAEMLLLAAENDDFAEHLAAFVLSLWNAGFDAGRIAGISGMAAGQVSQGEIEEARTGAAEAERMIEATKRGTVFLLGQEGDKQKLN
jgi:hypothetical protein